MINGVKPKFEGQSQYRPPLCFELTGMTFELSMDNGYDYTLAFSDRTTLKWNAAGEPPKTESYECLKGDDTTYLINVEVADAKPRTGLSLVIDMDNRLATCLIAHQGTNPKYPFLITNEVIFGAISDGQGNLNPKRHGYTTDMIGKAVEWTYNPDWKIIHIYCSEHYYRVRLPQPEDISEDNNTQNEDIAVRLAGYVHSDEPAIYVRIKEGMYLFSFVEENMEKLTAPTTRGNNLAFLMNLDRLTDVGRSFGINSEQKPENYTYGAYGRFVELDPGLLSPNNPYLV